MDAGRPLAHRSEEISGVPFDWRHANASFPGASGRISPVFKSDVMLAKTDDYS